MEDIEIKISKKSRMVDLSKSKIGNEAENLQGNLVFSFKDEFVNGQARLELTIDGQDSWIPLLKEEETYYCPIKSAITKKGKIEMQLVITENEDEDGIPIFKSNVFYVWVERSINAEIEQPEEYPTWIEIANEKLNQMDNLDIDATKAGDTATVTITKKDGTKESVEIKDGETGPQGETGPAGQDAKINGVNTINIQAGDNISIDQIGSTMKISATGGGGASEYVVRLTKDNDEITADKSINEMVQAYNEGKEIVGEYIDEEIGVNVLLNASFIYPSSSSPLIELSSLFDSGDDFNSIALLGFTEDNTDTWTLFMREIAYTAGTGIEITEGNVINNTLPNKIISITVDEQTMELDKTAGEINSLIEQGYLILLMGRLMFIEEYDSSRNKLYAYFYSGGYATKFTITGNQVTDYESLDVVYDNHYTHTDNNFTNADKNKLDGLENKIITVNANQQTMQLDKTADEIENYLNNGYIVMTLGYQVFRKDYNSSTHTIQLAIFFGSFGQVLTVTGNQVTGVSEYFYVNDQNYVHTDNNFSSYYKDKLDNAPEVLDLTQYVAGDTISDASIVAKLKDARTIIYYDGIYYRLAAIYGTGYVYTTMSGTDHGQWITLNYRSEYDDFYFYENDTAYWEVPSHRVQNLNNPTTDTYPSTLAVYNALQNAGGENYFVNIKPDYINDLSKSTIQKIIDNMLSNLLNQCYLIRDHNGYRDFDIYMASLSDALSTSTTSYVLNVWGINIKDSFGINNAGIPINKQAYNVTISWSNNIPTVSTISKSGSYGGTVIPINGYNTAWTPSTNYSPASKKYVDDSIASIPSGGGDSVYLGYLNDFTSSNRLDLTNLETGLYIIKVPNLSDWTSTKLYCKADNNGTDILGDFTFYNGTGTIAYNYLILNITNKISDMTITSSATQFGRLCFISIDSQGTLRYQIDTLRIKTTGMNYNSDTSTVYGKDMTTYTGYDATKTQTLKNVNGTLTWVDD